MKMKIILLVIVINIVISSFNLTSTAQNNKVENSSIIKNIKQPLEQQISQEQKPCNCNSKKDSTSKQGGLSKEDIDRLNEQGKREGWTFTIGENSATNYSLDSLCGSKVPDNGSVGDGNSPPLTYPTKFDWRDPNYNPTGRNCVTPVKAQGNCGSCWAFSAVGAVESAISIEDADTLDLSEQWLVSCNSFGDSCSGGQINHALAQMLNSNDDCGKLGAVLEADFPYQGTDAPCNCPHQRTYRITNYQQETGHNPTIDEIKEAIMNYGPVAALVCVGDAFQGYSGGIFNYNYTQDLNHAILLVGWDDSQGSSGVWFLKNSWGTGWGENGFMRIEYGCSLVGSYAYSVYYDQSWEKMTRYGNEFYSISGDWSSYGTHSVEMSPGGSSCTAIYKFTSSYYQVPSTLHIGVYFCDWGFPYLSDGPSVYLYNWNTGSYDLLHPDLGDWDVLRWVWMGTFSSTNYVQNSTGIIYAKIYAEDLDDTILDTVSIKYTTPASDLNCYDINLNWNNVIPGSQVTGSFKVNNIGEPCSKLNWTVEYYPPWGAWTFNPSSGTNLRPEDGPVTVQVTVIAPDQYGQTYSDEVWTRNSNDYMDYCNMPTSLTTVPPVPDLSCSGSLSWTNVPPGATVTGTFTVSNIGDPGSTLNWQITQWPSWGSWSFDPSSGTGLTPEAGPVTVTVTVVAPNQQSQTFTGNVKVVNSEDSSDYCLVPASLTTCAIAPDLYCSGQLSWSNVLPGDTVTGSFTVQNVGTPGSQLNWAITAWPSWGTWSFNPSSGTGLTPEEGPVTVQVTVVAPNQPGQQYSGQVTIVNQQNSSDSCTISASLSTRVPTADLKATGSLDWENIQPGATVTGSFTVQNSGDPGSNLDWNIASYPNWGTWSFNPSSGNDLTPEEGPVTVHVTVVAPNVEDQTYTGYVKVVNTENASDYENIPATLKTTHIGCPPSKPTITGKTSGKPGTKYDYTFVSTDPNNKELAYYIDWGDGSNTGWIGMYSSGTPVKLTHKFTSKGSFTIKAKARNTDDDESDWGTLQVTMPRSMTTSFFLKLLNHFPNLFQKLKSLFKF